MTTEPDDWNVCMDCGAVIEDANDVEDGCTVRCTVRDAVHAQQLRRRDARAAVLQGPAAEARAVNFRRHHPCDDCPFLRDGGIRLRRSRIDEIAGAMLEEGAGSTFACHKTTGVMGRRAREQQHCAGALVFAEKNRTETQAMQIARRLGLFEPARLDGHALVFDTLAEMRSASIDRRGK